MEYAPASMVNNDDWLSPLNYLDFLREYGPAFTINRMMSYESVKVRASEAVKKQPAGRRRRREIKAGRQAGSEG